MKTLILVLCLTSAAQAQDCSSGQCKLAPKVKAVVQQVAQKTVMTVKSRPRIFRRGCLAR
jgi:hypothetical protein